VKDLYECHQVVVIIWTEIVLPKFFHRIRNISDGYICPVSNIAKGHVMSVNKFRPTIIFSFYCLSETEISIPIVPTTAPW